MGFNRVRISKEASGYLRVLKGRTGLTPNILCRMALCFSLNNPQKPSILSHDEDGLEFNRFTLLGEWDTLFIALVKQRCVQDGLNPEKDLLQQFKAHLNNGIALIYPRIKYLGDIQNLLPINNNH